MTTRRGQAKGTGSGYCNLANFPRDPMVHRMAAKGMKQPQSIRLFRVAYGKKDVPMESREYQIARGSPVGTRKEYEQLFKGKKVKLQFVEPDGMVHNGLILVGRKKGTAEPFEDMNYIYEFDKRSDFGDLGRLRRSEPTLDLKVVDKEKYLKKLTKERNQLEREIGVATGETASDAQIKEWLDETESRIEKIDKILQRQRKKPANMQHAQEVKPLRHIGELYQGKEARDKRYKELKAQYGDKFRRSTHRNQQLHPQYVQDWKGSLDTGFGNTQYQTSFPVLYTIEFKQGFGEGDLQ
ncbi:hypothetical protein MUP79_06465 [Candidatus Bathyarchaeota archaeon]|nr:hypothetical protein [Candidatus Bathyarchaeota archaeon]